MTRPNSDETRIVVPNAPDIEGLSFRGFLGDEDFPRMLEVSDRCKVADDQDYVETLDDLRRYYRHLVNSDPTKDMLFVEMNGELIGYSRVWWTQIVDGPRTYGHFAKLVPEWRDQGIRRAMLRHNERRLTKIAATQCVDLERYFEALSSDGEHSWMGLLESEGYKPVRYGFEMVRPDLEEVPSLPLPEGLEVRPVRPEEYQTIWGAAREAFRDHWGFSEEEWADTRFESWQEDDTFTPDLWEVAWQGTEVAGMVLSFVDVAENRSYGRQRGYTETICVRRPWRRRGLARALIARSLNKLRELGMTEAALGVDAESEHGALQLYESLGYTVTKRWITYRKPLDLESQVAG